MIPRWFKRWIVQLALRFALPEVRDGVHKATLLDRENWRHTATLYQSLAKRVIAFGAYNGLDVDLFTEQFHEIGSGADSPDGPEGA